MATAKTRRIGPRVALALIVLVILTGIALHAPITGYARTGAAFAARTACSCRFIAGRTLSDCRKDFEPGMWAVFLSEDAGARSVTARVPLIARDTARMMPGYGCVLDPWRD